jgi:hypothetical protein
MNTLVNQKNVNYSKNSQKRAVAKSKSTKRNVDTTDDEIQQSFRASTKSKNSAKKIRRVVKAPDQLNMTVGEEDLRNHFKFDHLNFHHYPRKSHGGGPIEVYP